MKKFIAPSLLIFLLFSAAVVTMLRAENTSSQDDKSPLTLAPPAEKKAERTFRHVIRTDISTGDRFLNLGIAYLVQWTYYLGFQWDTIQDHGSFKNWYSNMYKPHFDHDSYDYNLIMHTLAGNYYYLFYRYRGYTKGGAILWSAITQLLFEFTVETITERPSFQDMYQTPILGAVLGITLEYLSCKLLSTDYTILHILGYFLNPFAAFPASSYQAISGPMVTANHYGYSLTFRF